MTRLLTAALLLSVIMLGGIGVAGSLARHAALEMQRVGQALAP